MEAAAMYEIAGFGCYVGGVILLAFGFWLQGRTRDRKGSWEATVGFMLLFLATVCAAKSGWHEAMRKQAGETEAVKKETP